MLTFDELTADLPVACRKFCAVCCTFHVTMTNLEGALVTDYLIQNNRWDLAARLFDNPPQNRFQPQFTHNEPARLPLEGEQAPEDHVPDTAGSCPMLPADDACPIYPVRPYNL